MERFAIWQMRVEGNVTRIDALTALRRRNCIEESGQILPGGLLGSVQQAPLDRRDRRAGIPSPVSVRRDLRQPPAPSTAESSCSHDETSTATLTDTAASCPFPYSTMIDAFAGVLNQETVGTVDHPGSGGRLPTLEIQRFRQLNPSSTEGMRVQMRGASVCPQHYVYVPSIPRQRRGRH
jgi:hypothetical protein